jgi:hypothetical protein
VLTICYMLNLSTICLRIISFVAPSSLTWTFALWAPRYLDFQVCVTAQFSSKCITCLCLTNASSSLCCEDVNNCICFLENLASAFVVGRHIVTFGWVLGSVLEGLLCMIGMTASPSKRPIEIFGPEGLRQWIRTTLKLCHAQIPIKYVVHELVLQEVSFILCFLFFMMESCYFWPCRTKLCKKCMCNHGA